MKKLSLLLVIVMVCALAASAGAIDLKGKFGITGQGGVAIPFSDFADKDKLAAKTGFGFGGAVEYFATNNIAIGGTFRYGKHDIDMGSEDSDVSASWKITNFGAFFKYVFPMESKFTPYVRLDAGFYKPKGTVAVGDVEGNVSFSTKLGIGGGGGVMYQASENVLIGGELLFHNAMTSDAKATVGSVSTKLDSDIQYISIFAGVTLLVGASK